MEILPLSPHQRINVIGTSGCGKSTFSKKLAEKLQLPYLEIDRIFWGPNWTEPPDDIFLKKLEDELNIDGWVLDGNYTRSTPIKWKNVQTVIWLDYSLWTVCTRAFKRAIGRAISQTEIWEGTGNRESFKKLLSKDSIVLWTLKTFYPNRKKYSACLQDKNYAYIQFIRLSNPGQAKQFLSTL